MHKKRGQISIFLILSIVLLFGGFVVYKINDIAQDELKRAAQASTKELNIIADFEIQLELALKNALFNGFIIWSNSGGMDFDTILSPFKEYPQRNIAYLLKDNTNYFDRDTVELHLESIVNTFFLSNADALLFTEYGYTVSLEPPTSEISFNFETLSIVTDSGISISKGTYTHRFEPITYTVDIDILPVLFEIEKIIFVLQNLNSSQTPYDFSTYEKLAPAITACGFSDFEDAYLVRILYNSPFKTFDVVRFDFLTDVSLVHGMCN